MTDKTNQAPQETDSELQNIIEAALFAAKDPMSVKQLMSLFPEDAQPSKGDVQNVLMALQQEWENRGIELKHLGKGWRFQSREKYATWLRNIAAQRPPRYSRALLETLSIIAYRQPVTRGDIEEIRGVAVSSDIIRTLEEREWVKQIGHRDVPGRPALFGTTQVFLEYFNLSSLRELPELMDKRELGEIAKDMNLTLPMDGVKTDETGDDAQNAADNESEKHGKEKTAEVIALHPTGSPSDISDVTVSDDVSNDEENQLEETDTQIQETDSPSKPDE